MNNRPDCLPCCLRRVLHAADLVTSDGWLHRKILAEAMQDLSRVDDLATPAEMIHDVSRQAGKALGVADPYAEDKRHWIDETTNNADLVKDAVAAAADSFQEALKFSLAANLIDCELRDEIRPGFSLKLLLDEVANLSFATDNVEDFREAVEAVDEKQTVLFVHSSAGELFFDRLLIEQMKRSPENVVSVVRESPVLGDATRDDAVAAGLDKVARIIDPGISCRGIPLNACSKEFRAEYASAGLVIAKGQAAYETLGGKDSELDGEEKEIFFLLRVKCAVMARELGVDVGDCVLEGN